MFHLLRSIKIFLRGMFHCILHLDTAIWRLISTIVYASLLRIYFDFSGLDFFDTIRSTDLLVLVSTGPRLCIFCTFALSSITPCIQHFHPLICRRMYPRL